MFCFPVIVDRVYLFRFADQLCYLRSVCVFASSYTLLFSSLAIMGNARRIISAAIPLVGAVLGYANPNECTGTCVNTHDPSIIQGSDGTYYRFSTGGKIAVHTAPDITGPWAYQGAALPDGSKIDLDGNQDLWVGWKTLKQERLS